MNTVNVLLIFFDKPYSITENIFYQAKILIGPSQTVIGNFLSNHWQRGLEKPRISFHENNIIQI